MGFRTVDFASDGIMIILFNTSEDLEKAYQIIKKEEGLHDVSKSFIDIGEISGYAVTSISDLYLVGGKTIYGGTSIQFIFTRCNALVYIDIFSRANNNETTFTYAQRVDERLSKLICH